MGEGLVAAAVAAKGLKVGDRLLDNDPRCEGRWVKIEGFKGVGRGLQPPDARLGWELMDHGPSYRIGSMAPWRRLRDEPAGGYCGLAGKP